jgi:hypothetical protein
MAGSCYETLSSTTEIFIHFMDPQVRMTTGCETSHKNTQHTCNIGLPESAKCRKCEHEEKSSNRNYSINAERWLDTD